MRASIHADGMTSLPRCDLAETAGLDDMGGTEFDAVGSDMETTVEMATRG